MRYDLTNYDSSLNWYDRRNREREMQEWEERAKVVLGLLALLAALLVGMCWSAMISRLIVCCAASLQMLQQQSSVTVGALLIAAVTFLWTASSVTIQLVFEYEHYRKPLFLTFYSSALFVCYLPFYPLQLKRLIAWLCGAIGCTSLSQRWRAGRVQYAMVGTEEAAIDEMVEGRLGHSFDFGSDQRGCQVGSTLVLASGLGGLFFAFNLCFNYGLELTTVSASSVSFAYWLLVASYWLLAAGCWLLAAG